MDASGQPTRTIAVVLYPGLTALDLVGPLQVLATFARLDPAYRIAVVGERLEPMTTDVPVSLVPDAAFDEVPHPYAILVPGGRRATIRALSDPVLRDYVRSAADTAELVTSVCTGSLILAAVGMLDGRPASTNWFFSSVLERLGGDYRHERWVRDGRLLTSAGVSAGIDMALYLVAMLSDEATARRVQLALDYDPQPPFGWIDWQRVPPLPRAFRGAIAAAAPFIAAKPRRMALQDRTARAARAGVGAPTAR